MPKPMVMIRLTDPCKKEANRASMPRMREPNESGLANVLGFCIETLCESVEGVVIHRQCRPFAVPSIRGKKYANNVQSNIEITTQYKKENHLKVILKPLSPLPNAMHEYI